MNRGFMEQMRAIIPSLAEGPSGSFESYVEDSLLTPSALAAEAAEPPEGGAIGRLSIIVVEN